MLILTAGVLFLYYAVPLIYPFLIGFALAYLLNPAVTYFQRKTHMPRWAVVLIVLILFLGAATGFLTLLVTNIVVEISSLTESLQRSMNTWISELTLFLNSEYIQGIVSQLNRFYEENPQYQNTINSNLTSTAKSLADTGSSFITGILNGIVSVISALPSAATITVIVLLAAFFISKDWYKVTTRLASWFPERTRKSTSAIWSDLQTALFGYIRAQLILITVTTIVVIIGLLILRVKYAFAIGLLTGFFDLLPYLGPGAVLVPWILFIFLQGNLYLGVGLSILYGIILINRQIIEPKVLASSIGLDPLVTLIAMFVGLKLFGVFGLIIGPVTLVILSAFHRANVFRDIYRYILHGSAPE
ncbi:sporulation integral membrane protein YtvI [Paenibacillus sp. CC-CFT747]|nr:sporulation integral membrane protein YtvI [Paenibacillus sp. CC-CFT747]